jgi:uncharacterized protein YunC (DUF1805 family)
MPIADLIAPGIVAADTITKLPPKAFGAVVISGSHGGRYPGALALKARARAVILNDAGVGKDEAGLGALALLGTFGMAAAAVSYMSCRIGDTGDMLRRGCISHANAGARAVGVEAGQGCREAAELLRQAPQIETKAPELHEGRSETPVEGGRRRVVLIDSAALVSPEDAGQIVVTGSHGGLVGDDPQTALRVEGFAAVFNDAGIGVDGAGTTRLPVLEARGIAAFTVAATSARIGEARSTIEDGIVSVTNNIAASLGARVGMTARDVLLDWARL